MELQVIDDKQAEDRALELIKSIETLQVVDQASYDEANKYNALAYEGKKAFHAWFDPIKEASTKQWQATNAQGKKIDEPFDSVIKITGKRMADWQAIERARVAEERRVAEEKARKEAEDAALIAAQALKDAGMDKAAEAVLETPVTIAKVEIDEPQKAEGLSYRDQYSAEVLSLMELVKAVAEGKAPIAYLEPNLTALNSWARSTKGTDAIPGVRVNVEHIQSRRG
jgi:hypothetical protein